MESIQIGTYKDDQNSKYVYLGHASLEAITLQHTERSYKLLDIVFKTPLDNGQNAEFLIRLETSLHNIFTFSNELQQVVNSKPLSHPYSGDLFSKAVSGKNLLDEFREFQKKHGLPY